MIIGTGFSGLLAAIRLQKKNCNDFVLLERSSELGGTWQVNSYPGAEVVIPTSLYSISFVPYPFKKNATCTAFYRKNMSEEVTSLSPEPVTGFIFSRKWFHLNDYNLLK